MPFECFGWKDAFPFDFLAERFEHGARSGQVVELKVAASVTLSIRPPAEPVTVTRVPQHAFRAGVGWPPPDSFDEDLVGGVKRDQSAPMEGFGCGHFD